MERIKSVSLGDIATKAGVSRMTVSYALRNSPQISAPTRKKVLAVAKKLGYVPDARFAVLMSGVRAAKIREVLPIAWLNMVSNPASNLAHNRDAWHTHSWMSPYLEGARARCHELGYKLEEIWLHEPGMTPQRISRILFHRGIQGLILAPSPLVAIDHISLDWPKFACASFEKGVHVPRLHRVIPDYFYNITLALKMLRRSGYRRIGLFLQQSTERRSHHAYMAGLIYFQSIFSAKDRIPPIFIKNDEMWGKGLSPLKNRIHSWIKKEKPDVILCQHSMVVQWLEERGLSVPSDIGVAHLAVEDDVKEWAGIWQHKREIGGHTAELVISMIQNNRYGLPEIAHDVLIPGYWKFGKTLLPRNPQTGTLPSTALHLNHT